MYPQLTKQVRLLCEGELQGYLVERSPSRRESPKSREANESE